MTTKCGLVFQVEIIEDDTLFFEDKFQPFLGVPGTRKNVSSQILAPRPIIGLTENTAALR